MSSMTKDRRPTRVEALAQRASARGTGSATWRALGTTVHVLTEDPSRLDDARAAVAGVLHEIDAAASRFRPDSELSRLNRTAGQGWRDLSPLLHRLLRVALDAAAWSGGLVDPTVGRSLVDLGYDRTFRLVIPDGPAITVAVHPGDGWQTIELDQDDLRARMPAGTVVDLGATAKGLAADLAAQAAFDAAGSPVLVNLGGDLRVLGAAAQPWQVLLADSSDHDLAVTGGPTILIASGGLATSSTTARRWRRGGSVMHHLIDPRSGLPSSSPWRTVSVLAPTCLLANTASTTAMLMDQQAPAWLSARGLAARLVATDGFVTTAGTWAGAVA